MRLRFDNRIEAGRVLASRLRDHAGQRDVLVLALPRGGVPVAAELAAELRLPMDLLCVRKIGVPGNAELAMGAVASGGVTIHNASAIESIGITQREFDRVAMRERAELERRERIYRGQRPPLDLRGKQVVLVDDGIATGSTMQAAIHAVRAAGARTVIVATPVIARDTLEELRKGADEVIAILAPETFFAVGEFYDDFSPTTDEEVIRLAAQHLEAVYKKTEKLP
jgi:putative phosphoribosyl transferase